MMNPHTTPDRENAPTNMREAGASRQSLDFSLAEASIIEDALRPVAREVQLLPQLQRDGLLSGILPVGSRILACLAKQEESDRGWVETLLCRFIASRWPAGVARRTHVDIMCIYRYALELVRSPSRSHQHNAEYLTEEQADRARIALRGSFGDAAAARFGANLANDEVKKTTSDVSSATRLQRQQIAKDDAFARKIQEEEEATRLLRQQIADDEALARMLQGEENAMLDNEEDSQQRWIHSCLDKIRVFVWDPIDEVMWIEYPSPPNSLFGDEDMHGEEMRPISYTLPSYGDNLNTLAEEDPDQTPRSRGTKRTHEDFSSDDKDPGDIGGL